MWKTEAYKLSLPKMRDLARQLLGKVRVMHMYASVIL